MSLVTFIRLKRKTRIHFALPILVTLIVGIFPAV